jgi:hypothetical protein
MIQYNPQAQDMRGQYLLQAAQTTADAKVGLVDDIGSALVGLAGAYGQSVDKKKALKGMDMAMGAMSDIGALPEGFLKKYNTLDDDTRPFIFEAIASPMFQAYNAGQSAAAQAQAWDKYKRNWGAGAGGSPNSANNQYGYVYQGP